MDPVQVQKNVIPEIYNPIIEAIELMGGQVFLIGGTPRDLMINRIHGIYKPPKDFDFEVFGVHPKPLQMLLNTFGPTKLIGNQFGVFTIQDQRYGDNQWALPRTESKIGEGHKDFEAEVNPFLPPHKAVLRRDFTMNTLMISSGGLLYDYALGVEDIEKKIIRHTSSYFTDDPLRPLRGVRLSSQLGFTMRSTTARLCASIADKFKFLPLDRIWGEMKKWALGIRPGMGLDVLVQTEWIKNFPLLDQLQGCPQDLEWHPEGDVFNHTRLATSQVALLARELEFDEDETLQAVFSTLLHDIAKPVTTGEVDGHITSQGHAEQGASIAAAFLKSIIPNQDDASHGDVVRFISAVSSLVAYHMVHLTYNDVSPRIVRRLARKIQPSSIRVLTALMMADAKSRGSASIMDKRILDIQRVAAVTDVIATPTPMLLRGQDLIDIYHLKPGVQFKEILSAAMEALDEGVYSDREGALNWVNSLIGEGNYVTE